MTDRLAEISRFNEANIAIGQDANQLVLPIYDGHATDFVRGHDILGLL